MKKETSEDSERRQEAHKCSLDQERSNFKWRPSLSTRRKHLTVPREDKKHTNHALDREDRTSKSKIKPVKLKINS